ncbi:MAG TPA: MBOAT family protein [Methylomirabilota bacterium]|jgi:D-alanyl-lipoteichoic acid acyltransferase DltB (MBOAT superfamily)
MLFNSWLFPPFLLLVLALYRVLPARAQNSMLLVASYAFYACWDWRFLGLLLISTTCDWLLARAIRREPSRESARRWVACSVGVNLAFLGFFKYFNFFIDSANTLLSGLGLGSWDVQLRVILPVGISFYTFQSISYIVDVYRGEVEPTRNPIDFALFVAFFPHMVAGPIMRSRDLLPQLLRPRRTTALQIREGLWLMLLGFFKKMAIGDNLAPIVDRVFSGGDQSGATVLLGVYAFAFEIYCDFSGYSDIARGVAKLLGVELMVNFDRPYLARNPSEFWRRWHISLSTWLRDYLYVPLGGNRGGRLKTYRNLMVTMILGGLWHGAAWNFILWGAFHGLLLAVHRLIVVDLELWTAPSRLGAWVSRLVMFHAVCYGWLLFRARSVEQIWSMTKSLAVGASSAAMTPSGSVVVLLASVIALSGLEMWTGNSDDPTRSPGWRWGMGPLVCSVMVLCIVILSPPVAQTFIYFQF